MSGEININDHLRRRLRAITATADKMNEIIEFAGGADIGIIKRIRYQTSRIVCALGEMESSSIIEPRDRTPEDANGGREEI